MRGIKHLLLPIYRIAAVVGIIEWNEFHSCLRLEALDALQTIVLCFLHNGRWYLEVEGIVIIVLRRVAERMLYLVELASHHDWTIHQSHLGSIILGRLISIFPLRPLEFQCE